MKVSEVTREDGLALTHLIKGFALARFDNVTGADLEALVGAKRWLAQLGHLVVEALSPPKPAPKAEDTPMKIKAMGPIGSSTKKSNKRK